MSADRRTILRRVGMGAVGTALGVLVLPSPPETPARTDTVPESSPPERVSAWAQPLETEDQSPIARYQYRKDGDEYVPTAPLNVVAIPTDEPGGLERTMAVLEDAGWLRRPEEYVRYAWDRETETYVRQEATAAQTFYGTSGRLHVRCWEFEGIISMQAHEDTGARPRHGIESYVDARDAIEHLYHAAGWDISPRALDLANEGGVDHDGYASVLTETPK